MDLPESQNLRDARIEELWKNLDTKGKGEIDINGLQRGLRKIDHPLKNAQNMLQDVVTAIDKNKDGVIQYDEFRIFVEETEKQLLSLFQSIDRDRDGRVDMSELQNAFKKAGLTVPNSKLKQFFTEVDENNDGYITFEEWRNFLLFLPHTQAPLKAVLSYYSSTVSVNAEGDTSIREETLEGLGTSPISSLLNVLFGSIVNIAVPTRPDPPLSSRDTTMAEHELKMPVSTMIGNTNKVFGKSEEDPDQFSSGGSGLEEAGDEPLYEKKGLLMLLPDPGYFVAGGLSGVVSRTATAPLDRLKVYLIASTGEMKAALPNSMKARNVVQAAKHVGGPMKDAFRELYAAGGMRSLFAGNGLNVLKVMPESAIKFGSYEFAKKVLADLEGHGNPKKINPYSKFIAGGIGGMVSQLVVYPLDTLKFRMQCELKKGGPSGNELIAATYKKMMKNGGPQIFYRGLTMGLIGMFPYAAIDLGTFESLKSMYARKRAQKLRCHEDDCQPGSLATGVFGAIAGAVGATAVYPLNVVRTRLQAQGTVLHPPMYTGIYDVFEKTVRKEGIRGLFKGISPNLLKVVPSVSITYVVYENSKRMMNLH